MSLGLVGEKLGMTRIFAEDGRSIPVTVVQVEPNCVTQVKSAEADGYSAVQVTRGSRKASRVSRGAGGHYAKAGLAPGKGLWEFRTDDGDEPQEAGGSINVELFEAGQKVDVQGTSIGKGYAGVMKRWGFGGLRATHGVSISHRSGGSIGQCQEPGRVFPGKKMAGQMGNVTRTQQGLEVVRVDSERNLLMVKGSVPGPKGGTLVIKPSVKSHGKGGGKD